MRQIMRVSQVQRALGVSYRQALAFATRRLGAYQLVPNGTVLVPTAAFCAYCKEIGIDPASAFVETEGQCDE